MKHIVFTFGYYFPEAGSTSLCAIKVMNDLYKKHRVAISCVCGTNGKQSVERVNNIVIHKLHHVSFTDQLDKTKTKTDRLYTKTLKIIRDILSIRHYPDTDIEYSKAIYSTLEEIEKVNHIDCIVAVYMPKQCITGAFFFKKKHPETKIIAYYLDTLRSNKPKLLPARLYSKMIDNYENRIFKTFDKIILMEYGAKYYSKYLCNKYSEKLALLGLPSLEILDLVHKEHKGVKCCYIGMTYSDIRNPLFAMRVFDEAHKRDNRVFFEIYGSSNMKDELNAWQLQHPDSFYYHGFIGHENIKSVYEETDYIVSIGNKLKGVVPGKTFEIIGTLKPIIHFTDVTNDSSLEFIKQYPNACIINYDMSVEDATERLLSFIRKPYYMCDPQNIEKTFSFASPSAVSNLIYETCR